MNICSLDGCSSEKLNILSLLKRKKQRKQRRIGRVK